MCRRKGYKRCAGLGVAIVLFAGLGVAIVLFPGRYQSPSSSPRTVRPGDQREAKPITADLVTAIRNADAQAVRKLVENGTDVNARDAGGNTSLILASFYASPECLELLIEKGADVNAANKAGATPRYSRRELAGLIPRGRQSLLHPFIRDRPSRAAEESHVEETGR